MGQKRYILITHNKWFDGVNIIVSMWRRVTISVEDSGEEEEVNIVEVEQETKETERNRVKATNIVFNVMCILLTLGLNKNKGTSIKGIYNSGIITRNKSNNIYKVSGAIGNIYKTIIFIKCQVQLVIFSD